MRCEANASTWFDGSFSGSTPSEKVDSEAPSESGRQRSGQSREIPSGGSNSEIFIVEGEKPGELRNEWGRMRNAYRNYGVMKGGGGGQKAGWAGMCTISVYIIRMGETRKGRS